MTLNNVFFRHWFFYNMTVPINHKQVMSLLLTFPLVIDGLKRFRWSHGNSNDQWELTSLHQLTHTEDPTKWPPFADDIFTTSINTHWRRDKMAAFCRRHFQSHFPLWNFLHFYSLKYVSNSPVNNLPTLVQIVAWRWTDDSLLTHICVTLLRSG